MKKNFLFFFSLLLIFSCEAFFLEDISEEIVVLLAPVNNATVSSGTIDFHWEEITDAEEYVIQIAAPSFESASQILLDSVIASTTISKDLEAGSYEWRIKGENADSSTVYSTSEFLVED